MNHAFTPHRKFGRVHFKYPQEKILSQNGLLRAESKSDMLKLSIKSYQGDLKQKAILEQ